MNEIVNKLLLASEKFIPEMHLKQPRLSYNVCGPFTKKEFTEWTIYYKEKIQKFKETGDQTIFTKTNLIRLVFSMR